MRVLFLLFILNISAFAQDRYFLHIRLYNCWLDLEIDNVKVDYLNKGKEFKIISRNRGKVETKDFFITEITEYIKGDNIKKINILVEAVNGKTVNNFQFHSKIIKNHQLVFEKKELTLTSHTNKINISEFLVDK